MILCAYSLRGSRSSQSPSTLPVPVHTEPRVHASSMWKAQSPGVRMMWKILSRYVAS